MVTASIAEHATPVLHIDTGRTWGGGQQQVLCLHRGLLQRGVSSILVCAEGSPLAWKAATEGLSPIEMKLSCPIRVVPAVRVARLARLHNVRTLHMHTSPAHSVGLLAERLLKNDVHKVVSRMVAFPRKMNPLRRRKYLGRNIRYLAVSKAVKRTLLELGVPEGGISVVYPGIEVEKYSHFVGGRAKAIAAELGIGPDHFVVGSVGSLLPCKGHAVLIEALERVAQVAPNLICLVVGEGPERSNLESLIRRNRLGGKVLLTGQRDDIPELLSLLDLFVMPSLQEGLGLALLEAMAAGKPAIASDTGGMPEIIAQGQNGMLVPPGDSRALAKAIITLIRDPLHRFALGEKGRGDVQERFSSDAMIEGTLAVYRSLR